MTFKMAWLRKFYLEPLQALARELDEAEENRRRRAIAARLSNNECAMM